VNLPREKKEKLYELLKERDRRRKHRKYLTYYPDLGPLRRELYPKHTAFFEAGKGYIERAMMAANRVGKTEGVGGYELTCHLTGLYPEWWKGKRFDHPVDTWASGSTGQTTRDILQAKLMGPISEIGTGLIPGDCIVGKKRKQGIPDAFETVLVRHKPTGGISKLGFKSYDQKRKSFEGTEKHVILLDEEPDMGIYSECLIRIMATGLFGGGMIMLTFTPLQGVSVVVKNFMPSGKIPEKMDQKFVIQATWDDAPHLTEEEKAKILAGIPEYQRAARTKGVPILGSGLIYPLDEKDIRIDDFPIPVHFPRAYALDVGWNCTAALWGAWNLENDTVYLTGEYKRGKAEPPVHVSAIQAKGKSLRGVADPHARDSSQRDGKKLMNEYNNLGLDLSPADNAVEAGIFDVWTRLATGRLKVFRSLSEWFAEYRLYSRNESGKIVKQDDHLMDDTRYLVRSGLTVAKVVGDVKKRNYSNRVAYAPQGWMGN